MPAYQLKPAHASLNPDHTLAKGLVLECPFFYHAQDYSGNGHHGTLNAFSGAKSYMGVGKRGNALIHDATTQHTDFGNSAYLPTDDVTVVLIYEKRDGTARASYALAVETETDGERFAISLPFSDSVAYWDWGGFLGDKRITAGSLTYGHDIWILTAGPRGMEMYQNGVLRASNSANNTRSASTGLLKLGRVTAEGLTSGDLVNYELLRIYDRQLSYQEIQSTTLDPWTIYEDEPDEDWFPTVPPDQNSTYLHALTYPIRSAKFTQEIPYLDSQGGPTVPVTPDTEITLDPDAADPVYNDTTNEITSLGGGWGLLTYTALETDCTLGIVRAKVASGPKDTLASLRPRDLPLAFPRTTLASASASGGTLTVGPGYDVTGCYIRTAATDAFAALNEARKMTSYNVVSGAFEVKPPWEDTTNIVVAGRAVDILLPEGMVGGALKALNAANPDNRVNVTLLGAVDLNWAGVHSQDSVVNLTGTRVRLHADYDLYECEISFVRDQANGRDEYTVVWRKDGVVIASGVSSPTIRVIARSDWSDLLPETAMTQNGTSGYCKHDETANRIPFGEAAIPEAKATIDGAVRTFVKVKGLDSV